MTLPPKPNNSSAPHEPTDSTVGFKKPPKHTQFKKGKSGNPRGRPKAPPFSLNIKSMLDGVQQGKNGELLPKREALSEQMLRHFLNRCERHKTPLRHHAKPGAFGLFAQTVGL